LETVFRGSFEKAKKRFYNGGCGVVALEVDEAFPIHGLFADKSWFLSIVD
jgi:hypothetical protein